MSDAEPGPRPRPRRARPRLPAVMFTVGMAGGAVNMLTFQDPAAYAFFGTPVAAAIAMLVDESHRRDEAST